MDFVSGSPPGLFSPYAYGTEYHLLAAARFVQDSTTILDRGIFFYILYIFFGFFYVCIFLRGSPTDDSNSLNKKVEQSFVDTYSTLFRYIFDEIL